MGKDGLHGDGVLDGGDDAQPAAPAEAGQDIEIAHAADQRRPGPDVRGEGGAAARKAGLEREALPSGAGRA